MNLETNLGRVKISLAYYPERGLYPVKLYVRFNGTGRYYSIRVDVTPKQFKDYCAGKIELPIVTQEYKAAISTATFLIEEDDFSLSSFSRLINKGKLLSVNEFIDNKIDELQEKGKQRTAKTYEELKSSLEVFYGVSSLTVNDVTLDFINRYVAFMRRKGYSNTTIGIRLRNLRHILNLAVQDHAIKKNPMDGYHIPSSQRRVMDIEESTLNLLLTLNKEDTTPGRYSYLLVWRLQYYCNGMNLVDLLHLKRTDIVGNEIRFVRHKTSGRKDKVIIIPVTQAIQELLNVLSTGRKYVLPFLDGTEENSKEEMEKIDYFARNMNRALKCVCKSKGIKDKVSSYTARHAFATRLLRAGVPVEYISNALGHSSILTTQHYLEGYTSEQRFRIAEILNVQQNQEDGKKQDTE